jgi:hypothetical protein
VGDDPAKLTNWQALVLGLVQGMTELLPISSSGHLILVPWLFDWTYLKENDAFNQTFDVSLHLGTCVAVGAYFWHDVVTLLKAWFGTLGRRSIKTRDERLAWVVLVATIPAALAGFLLEDVIAEHMGEPWQIAIFLAVFGLLLGWGPYQEMPGGWRMPLPFLPMWKLLPGFSAMRGAGRYVDIVSLGLSLASGYALAAARPWLGRARWPLAAALILFTIGWSSWTPAICCREAPSPSIAAEWGRRIPIR